MFSYENCLVAIMEGSERKRSKREVMPFVFSDEEARENPSCYHQIDPKRVRPFAERLCAELRSGAWQLKPPKHRHVYLKSKAKAQGKWRDLYVPDFEGHIVNHMLMQATMPAFRRGIHPHSAGSVPGRGPGMVVNMVSRWLQRDRQCRYFVKLDIRQFFPSIDPDILMGILRRKIKDRYALDLFDQFIHCSPAACPMGLYSSPWLANLYLEGLDHFISQQLFKIRRGKRLNYVRHYMRYMDDMLLIGTSKSDLRKAVKRIEAYLIEELNLTIKPTWEIKRIGQHIFDGRWRLKPDTYWCDFVGYKFAKDATILRSGIFLATRRLVKKMYKAEYYTPHQCAALNSRLGWAAHCDSNHFLNTEVRPFVNIKKTRRVISDVDKKRKQRCTQAGRA